MPHHRRARVAGGGIYRLRPAGAKELARSCRGRCEGLRAGGLAGGRAAVSRIVGRDPQTLDAAGVVRAAIESLAENFCDGVVAPAFWYAVLGLPGIIAYKMINTANSMIGHRSEKYLHFGRVAARTDDVANWLPARLSALLISAAAAAAISVAAARAAFGTALRDAGLHRSPNAGWPEAAMAGALDIALGGPRKYAGETVSQTYLKPQAGWRWMKAIWIGRCICTGPPALPDGRSSEFRPSLIRHPEGAVPAALHRPE